MAFTMGLAAGVMILVSFVELLAEAIAEIGFGLAHLAFFGGIAFIFLLDLVIPHEYGAEHQKTGEQANVRYPTNQSSARSEMFQRFTKRTISKANIPPLMGLEMVEDIRLL